MACQPRRCPGVGALLLVALTVAASGASAQAPALLVLDDARGEHGLAGYLELLEDRSTDLVSELHGGMTLEQVRRATRGPQGFETMTGDRANLGVTNHARWLRMRVRTDTGATRWALIFDPPQPFEIELHDSDGDGTPLAINGQRIVTGERPGRAVFFELPLSPGVEKTFYLRAIGRPLRLAPRIVPLEHVYREHYDQNLLLGLYYGIAIAMLIYNLFLGAVLRDRAYLYYAASVTLMCLVLFAHDGLLREYVLDPESPRGPTTHGLILTAMVLSVLAFTREVLGTARRVPRLDRALKLVMAAAAAISALAIGAYFEHSLVTVSVPGSGVALMMGMALVLTAGVACMLQGYRPAVYFTLASSLLLTAWILAAMRGLGAIEAGSVIDHGVRIGSVADMLLWSLALADRIRVLRSERTSAEARALAAEVEGERAVARARQQHLAAVIETQDAERKRIASDLHDSIGQIMLALKNRLVMDRGQRGGHGQGSDTLAPIIDLAQQGIDETRNISHNLHPHQLERLGLARSVVTAVDTLARSAEPTLLAEVDGSVDRLPREQRLHVFRIVQECLSNAIRHAGATRIDLFMAVAGGTLEVIVEDDGVGLPDRGRPGNDQAPGREGQGLANLRERVAILGGQLSITSAPGEGTKVEISVPAG